MSSIGIVGASLAGLRTVEALRTQGYEGSITVFGCETEMPYNRPPLSKQFLTGEALVGDLSLVTDGLGATWRLGTRAIGLEVMTGTVVLADGGREAFDAVVLATGASARNIPLPALRAVHTLRSLGDAQAILESLNSGGPVVVIGAGLIGCEIASSCVRRGQSVTLVDSASRIMERAWPQPLSERLQVIHEAAGVDLRLGASLKRLQGQGSVAAVELHDGNVLPAQTLIVAVGSVPNTRWLMGSGLEIADGVLTDAACRAVGGAGRIFAVGDVCRRAEGGGRIPTRDEHWSSAAEHAQIVAHVLTRGTAAGLAHPIPFYWSEQHGRRLQVVGRPGEGDNSVEHHGKKEGSVALTFTRNGRTVGAAAIDFPGRIAVARRELATNNQAHAGTAA